MKGLHKQQKGATYSVTKQAEAAWIKSELGKAWAAERKQLLAADEHNPDNESDVESVELSVSSSSSSSSSSS